MVKEAIKYQEGERPLSDSDLTRGRQIVEIFVTLYQAFKEKQDVPKELLDESLLPELDQVLKPHGAEVVAKRPGFYGLNLSTRPFLPGIFYRLAILEGDDLRMPSRRISAFQWFRQRQVMDAYYNSEAVYSDIAITGAFRSAVPEDQHPKVSTQMVSLIMRSGMKNLWGNALPQLQQAITFDELRSSGFKKPWSLPAREIQSLRRGGRSVAVARLVAAGKEPNEISAALGITPGDFHRRVLHSWGIELPYKRQSREEISRLLENLQKEEDVGKIQELFGQVKLSFLYKHTRGDKPLLLTVPRLIRRAQLSLHGQTSSSAAVLRGGGIPVGGPLEKVIPSGPQKGYIQKAYFLLRRHEEAAVGILQ